MKHSGSASRRADARAGFSLIETLAALAIAAAIFAVVAEFAGRALRTWNRGEVTISVMEMLTRGLGRLSTDLSLALPMSTPGTDGATVLFSGDANQMMFAAATGFSAGDRGVELLTISSAIEGDSLVLGACSGPRCPTRRRSRATRWNCCAGDADTVLLSRPEGTDAADLVEPARASGGGLGRNLRPGPQLDLSRARGDDAPVQSQRRLPAIVGFRTGPARTLRRKHQRYAADRERRPGTPRRDPVQPRRNAAPPQQRR